MSGDISMRFLARPACLLIGCVLVWPTQGAAAATWSAVGPEGGVINAVAADPGNPSTIYAGTEGAGLFKSTDRGAHWSTANQGLSDLAVTALAIDAGAGSTVYAGTEAHGVFKSTDGGGTWQASSSGLPGTVRLPAIGALSIDPQVTATLYLGLSSGAGGVYKSVDGGGHWSATGAQIASYNEVHALAVDGAAPSTVFAGTADGVWRSTDGGASWTQLDPSDLANTLVVGVTISPDSSSVVYAAESSDVWKSTDGGDHFALLPAFPAVTVARTESVGPDSPPGGEAAPGVVRPTSPSAPTVKRFVVTPFPTPTPVPGRQDSAAVAGVAAATGAGAVSAGNGRPSGARAGIRAPETPAASAPLVLAVATDGGVLATSDDGAHWSVSGANLATLDTRTLAVSSGSAPRLFVGSGGAGVFTTDDLAVWRPADAALVATAVTAFAFPGANVVIAGVQGGGVSRSTDGGRSWTVANSGGVEDATVNAFAVAPGSAGTVWAATDVGVFVSPDAGATWSAVHSGIQDNLANAVAVDPTNPNIVYVGGSGVRRSSDGGSTWQDAGSGLGAGPVMCMAIDPSAPETLYAGLYGQGVFRTADGGASWQAANGGQGFMASGLPYAIAIDPLHHLTVYAGLDSRAVWKTTDGGASWAQVAVGLQDQSTLEYSTIMGIALDPTNAATVYAAAGASNLSAVGGPVGLFVSGDGGATWQPVGAPLAGVPVISVAVDPSSSGTVLAGTGGQGAFRLGAPPAARVRRRVRRLS